MLLNHSEISSLSALYGVTAQKYKQARDAGEQVRFFSDEPPRLIYSEWLTRQLPNKNDAKLIDQYLDSWASIPKIHLAMIVLPGDESRLVASLQSLAGQYHSDVALTLVSSMANPGIVGSNLFWIQSDQDLVKAAGSVLASYEADWVGFVEPGDKFENHVFLTCLTHVKNNPAWQAVYCDEDTISPVGINVAPFLKPDFNLDMLRSMPYVGRFILFQRQHFIALGGLSCDCAGYESYDLVLKTYETVGARAVGHIHGVLFHQQPAPARLAMSASDAAFIGKRVVASHLARLGIKAGVADGLVQGTFRVQYPLDPRAMVSIVVLAGNNASALQHCIESLFEHRGYANVEILIVAGEESDASVMQFIGQLEALALPGVRVLDGREMTSVGATCNFAMSHARGEYCFMMEDRLVALHEGWLSEMLSILQRDEVAVVGARILSPHGEIVHSGIILGVDGVGEELLSGISADDVRHHGRLQVEQNFSAVSTAGMLVRKTIYDQLGGINPEIDMPGYAAIDFCLRVRELGLLVSWTPYATLMQRRSEAPAELEAGLEDKIYDEDWAASKRMMWQRWLPELVSDPAYNRCFSLLNAEMKLEEDVTLTRFKPAWKTAPRVLAQVADREGCGEYRVISPMRGLANAGLIQPLPSFQIYTPVEMERISPDAIIFQRQINKYQVDAIERHREFNKHVFTVFEIDDLITNLPQKSMHRDNFPADMMKVLRRAISLCDRLVVSTEPLAQAYGKFASEVRVVPNYLERARWAGLSPNGWRGEKPRVGWAGSTSHTGDLELIAPVIRELSDEVDWVMMGMCPDELRPYVRELIDPVSIDLYPSRLAALNLDLAIAPLEYNAFNEAKSHLKLLEYGILGYPVICTDIAPYQGDYPVTRVRNLPGAWVQAIRDHLGNPDESRQQGEVLRRYVDAHWMLEDNLHAWKDAWIPG